jgi:hypothetical protein
MMQKIFTFLFFIPAICFAQSKIKITDQVEQISVDAIPLQQLPKGAEELRFFRSYSDSVPVLYLGYPIKENQLKVIAKFKQDAEWFNGSKADARFKNDTISLWSQQPFRATQVVYLILWKNKKAKFISSEMTDPSWEAIALAEKALSEGKIREAIDYYEQVQYPSSYMDENKVGLQILSKANEMGLKMAQTQQYKASIQYIQTALEYYTLFQFTEVTDEKTLTTLFDDQYLPEYKDSFGLWMTNYGYFLYKAASIEESISFNSKLHQTYPALPGPYLQHADALYDLGKKIQAKPVYAKYISLMKSKGNEKLIPPRAFERLK